MKKHKQKRYQLWYQFGRVLLNTHVLNSIDWPKKPILKASLDGKIREDLEDNLVNTVWYEAGYLIRLQLKDYEKT